jgi:lysophospholipase L1-like esterase
LPKLLRPALAALLALCGAPALAAPAEPVPPGEGMMAQPCPAQDGLWFGAAYVKQYDWAWLCRYQAENRAAASLPPPEAVFIGDSITEGWLKGDAAFFSPARLDRGISGQTSPQMLLRFQQDVIALRPRVVHIMAGTNDIGGNTGPTSAEAYQNNIRAMVDMAQASRVAVVLASIPPAAKFYWRPALQPAAHVRDLNLWLRDFALARGLVYADYYTVLTDADGGMRAEFSGDGVHPNAAGYAAMRPVAERALQQALRQAGRRRRN